MQSIEYFQLTEKTVAGIEMFEIERFEIVPIMMLEIIEIEMFDSIAGERFEIAIDWIGHAVGTARPHHGRVELPRRLSTALVCTRHSGAHGRTAATNR